MNISFRFPAPLLWAILSVLINGCAGPQTLDTASDPQSPPMKDNSVKIMTQEAPQKTTDGRPCRIVRVKTSNGGEMTQRFCRGEDGDWKKLSDGDEAPSAENHSADTAKQEASHETATAQANNRLCKITQIKTKSGERAQKYCRGKDGQWTLAN